MSEQKINGRTFKVEPLPATQALKLQARILKVIGPGVGRLKDVLSGVGQDKTDEQKSAASASALTAIADIFASVDPDNLVTLQKDIIEIALIRRDSGEYGPCDLDGDFTEFAGDIYPVMFFVLKEQFGSFFTGLQASGILKVKAA